MKQDKTRLVVWPLTAFVAVSLLTASNLFGIGPAIIAFAMVWGTNGWPRRLRVIFTLSFVVIVLPIFIWTGLN